MRINNNSTTKEPECDNAESQHEDNKAKKTYNNNFNNNNNHMATTEDDTRLPKFSYRANVLNHNLRRKN